MNGEETPWPMENMHNMSTSDILKKMEALRSKLVGKIKTKVSEVLPQLKKLLNFGLADKYGDLVRECEVVLGVQYFPMEFYDAPR